MKTLSELNPVLYIATFSSSVQFLLQIYVSVSFNLLQYLAEFLQWGCGDGGGVFHHNTCTHEGISKSFRTESIRKSTTTTTINTHWGATRRDMAAKFTRLIHKIEIQLHLVAESCTICSSRSRRPFRKLLDKPSYTRPICMCPEQIRTHDSSHEIVKKRYEFVLRCY
jgi:hypothetical protein